MASNVLEIKGVTKQFGGLYALSDISLEVKSGEIFGIIGPNGAGKTTLFNVISGFDHATSGTIIYNGEDVTGKNVYEHCIRGLSRTFQNIRIFKELSVLDNLIVGMHNQIHTGLFNILLNDKKEKEEEKKAVETAHEILKYLKIDDVCGEIASNLPYGSQRKVEIGRALASEPNLILLDEPSAGMNQNETMELMELIKGIQRKNITIIVIEHNMQFMMNLCDRIAVLNFGKLLTVGKPQEVQTNKEVIDAYLGTSEEDDTCCWK